MISVVVPVYNVADYLNRCVKSIVEQTYDNLEIILVDDGSTDQSGTICDEWAEKDERIRVVHKVNGGLSSARNSGIDIAVGTYITFVDSDDYIEPDMYQVMLSELEKHGADIVCAGRITHLDDSRTKLEFMTDQPTMYTASETVRKVLINQEIDVAAWDKLYKIEIFKDIRYPVGKINEDAAVIFQILNHAKVVVHCGKAFYHYVYRSQSISKNQYTHKKYDVYTNCRDLSSYIKKHFIDSEEICKAYCAQCAAGVLQTIYETPDAKKDFRLDYLDFRKLLREGIWSVMKTPEISVKNRFRVFMIFCGLNSFYNMIKKVVLKWKRS